MTTHATHLADFDATCPECWRARHAHAVNCTRLDPHPALNGMCLGGSVDPIRPPETDEEPWTVAADEERGLWLSAVLLLIVLALGIAIGRLSA